MPDLNKANREVCEVNIVDYATGKPFMYFDTANTTTAGLSGDTTFANKKGKKAIAFHNPIEGTISIEAQVLPFKAYALLAGGKIENSAIITKHLTVTCAEAGKLAFTDEKNGTISATAVYVFPAGEYGNETVLIEGTYADGKFTATSEEKVKVNSAYEVCYVATHESGVKKVSIGDNSKLSNYKITMETWDKDEEENIIPFYMIAYKAAIQRSFDLSFSSDGDAQTVTFTFDLLADKNGDVLDLVEITE